MFLNNSSMTRPPPSLLPGSDGTRWPAFNRYYEAATTTRLVLRHSVCSVVPQYLGSISSFRSSSRGNRRADARVLFNRCHPLALRCLVPRTPSVLPSSLRTPRASALLSDSGRASTPGSCQRFGVALAQDEVEGPSDPGLSKLNHTAFALAVYASCRPLGRRRKTRFRWLAKPFRVGFFIPTEFVWRVSAVASPLPGFILARRPLPRPRKLTQN